jgi:hypothetical protein
MSDLDREEICPDCHAGPDAMDARITSVKKDDATGDYYTVRTWHTEDCTAYTLDRILMEDAVRRSKDLEAWAEGAFPAAHERVVTALMSHKFAPEAQPFVAALVELVDAQLEDTGRFVPLHRWAEILDSHFPPEGEEPSRKGEEPTP